MKVICDNCRAVYKIPDEKLAKPVNKATCRKCGHRMLIPRPRQGANPDEKTLVTAVPPTPPPAPSREYLHERATSPLPEEEPDSTMPGLAPAPQFATRRPSMADDVQLSAATPMPAEREARPAGGWQPPPPPAPDLSMGRGTPASVSRSMSPPPPPPRAATPAPAQRSSAPRNGTPNSLGTGGDWKPPDAILASINPSQFPPEPQRPPEPQGRAMPTPAPTPSPVRRAAAPQPAPLPPPPPAPAPYNAPSQARNPVTSPSIIAMHDPANDLVLAMFGAGGGMVGTFILVLAFLTVSSLPPLTLVLIGIGMLLAFIGGMATLLVIITGGGGRRPARPLVSVGLAIVVGTLVTTVFVGTLLARPHLVGRGTTVAAVVPPTVDEGSVLAASQPPSPPVVPPVAVADPAVADPSKATTTTTTTTTTTAAPPPASDASTASKSSKSSSNSSSSSSSSSGGVSGPVAETFAPRAVVTHSSSPSTSVYTTEPARTTPPPPPADDPIFMDDDPPPPPKSTAPDTVSDTVIDTILRNSIDVKKCFFSWQKQTGDLPARVTVSFKITPDGAISGPAVIDAELKGSTLDACLARALTGIAMPPSQNGRSVKYPFQLQ